MRKIKLLILISILINILLSSCNQKSTEGEWVQLFNGKDLTGWTPKIVGYEAGDNFGNTFRVEDGLIKVRYDQYDMFKDRFGHLFYKDEYSHYKLRVEYRFQGDQLPDAPGWAYRNSGIMLHGQTPETMELDQDFPTSIEVQLLGCGSIAERTTMNLCTPGTNVIMNNQLILDHCTNSNSKFYFDDIWVTAEVEVRGNDVIYHILDGDTVLQYGQPQLDERDFTYAKLIDLYQGDKMLSKGTISLQSEGHPIDFRKVEIQILK